MRKICTLFCLLLLCAPASTQTVYKTIDEDGNVTFTDAPKEESEEVDTTLRNIQPPPPYIPLQNETDAPQEEYNYQLTLTNPQDGQRFGPAQRLVSISTKLNRKLKKDHYIELFFGGEKVSGPSKVTSTSVQTNIKLRGEKVVQARVVDADGNVLAKSNTATIYVIIPTH